MSTFSNLPNGQLPPPPTSYRRRRQSTTTTCRRPATTTAATYRHRPSPANHCHLSPPIFDQPGTNSIALYSP
ncbi:unnamed protein product [Prunus armeniaca]|uniref:Uncharacterized protein n=1 Tax=Prunus armeniaca TaxID=36596 RepID=A0A6J5Y9D6_PRUAR|nr:unnamed protein product [Prunus armeniaca]